MPPNPLVSGIVLAAGLSSRMGRPKALLRCAPGDDTFVGRIVRTLRAAGLDRVAVIGRAHDGPLIVEVAQLAPQVEYVPNMAAERGQLSSLVAGIDHAEANGADAVLVMPVDMPLVRAQSVAAVLGVWRTCAAPILRVTHDGRHGHPVIFGAEVFRDLRAADPAVGAKAVIRAYADRLVHVEVDDPGVLHDVDLPEEYARLLNLTRAQRQHPATTAMTPNGSTEPTK